MFIYMTNVISMTITDRKSARKKSSTASALILAVVLTSLLAIVGVLFVMIARVDKIASSALMESKELDAAVDTVVARICEELVLDVPDVAGQEYYDYPDQYNRWLADLEPYQIGGNYYWRQVSDVTGILQSYARDVQAKVIREYDVITDFNTPVATADADGDGVGDSKWIRLIDITSSRGKPVYAAIRIINNGGMLNVNTAFKLDPGAGARGIDGSSQMHVNAMALAGRPGNPPTLAEEDALLQARANYGVGVDPRDLSRYEQNVIWSYAEPNGPYTPFDISDELELRYRFILNHTGIDTRLEAWGGEFRKLTTLSTPVTSGGQQLDAWFRRVSDPGIVDPNYEYRHLATVYNMDRIINPAGSALNNGKMVNVNVADIQSLYAALRTALRDAAVVDADRLAAQTAVNIVDHRDNDSSVTVYTNPDDGVTYYGFERPCIYVSELAYRTEQVPRVGTFTSYAIELFKPYFEDGDPAAGQWQLVIDGRAIPITWSGTRRFHVIRFEDANAPASIRPLLPVAFNDPDTPADPSAFGYDPRNYPQSPQEPSYSTFGGNSTISLQRQAGGTFITVDSVTVPAGWLNVTGSTLSLKRDANPHKCIRRLWTLATQAGPANLGQPNSFAHSDAQQMQAHPANQPFTSIGEIGTVFCRDVYDDAVIRSATEAGVRLDLANPAFAQTLRYLSVIDPAYHGWGANETRIKGRININTAPWFVMAQLPWMRPPIAQAIVAYRDQTAVPGGPDYSARPGVPGFRSIGDLVQVSEMGFYAADPADLAGSPDLTPRDGAGQDFEERDMIFARISNLITVRSDVFTAYILARIGVDGPQKRFIAVLDRSSVAARTDRVKIVALQSVPDPR